MLRRKNPVSAGSLGQQGFTIRHSTAVGMPVPADLAGINCPIARVDSQGRFCLIPFRMPRLGLVQSFQQIFGTKGAPPQVVIDGDDPGDVEGVALND